MRPKPKAQAPNPRAPKPAVVFFALPAALLSALAASCPSGSRDRALFAYAEAAAAYDSGRLDAALAGAKKSLALDSSFLPALVLAGKSSYFLGDDAGAVSALKRAVRATPRAGEAALWLARAYRAAGRAGEAKRTCEALLSSNPADAAALRLAAGLADERGDAAATRSYLDRAIDSAAEAGLALAERAAIHWAAGNGAAAVADLDAALAALPEGGAARKAVAELRATISGRSSR